MKRILWTACLLILSGSSFGWGFYGHRKINQHAVFLLPPELLHFYKKNLDYITEHAVDPDKRRYAFAAEGPRHYIDIDHYGQYPYDSLPRQWAAALERYSADTLQAYGIVPWWIPQLLNRLTAAFRQRDAARILRLSAELGHYIGDAHVPLHACSNHNGQFSNQQGIHGFWESRIPELLADQEWDFLIGRARYIDDPQQFIWQRVLESAAAADTVLRLEKMLSQRFPPDQRYAFEERNGQLVRQYAAQYTRAYNRLLGNMVERRMRASIFAVASFWFTAWVNAGQPSLSSSSPVEFSEHERKAWDSLNFQWKQHQWKGRSCE